MRTLWTLLCTISLIYNAKAVDEHLIKADESELKECSFETCGPNPFPIPMLAKLQALARSLESSLAEDAQNTNFTCGDKPYIPGFYADTEMNCQAFHLCMNDTVDHFLCPMGTAFDQRYLMCKLDGKRYCDQTAAFYSINSNMKKTFPLISGIPAFDLKKREAQSNYERLKYLQDLSDKFLERELNRIFILVQFFEVSYFMPEIVVVEDDEGQARALDMSYYTTKGLLDLIMRWLFPLLPIRYPLLPEELKAEPRTPEETTRSYNGSDGWGDFVENEPEVSEESGYDAATLGTFHNTTATDLGAKTESNMSSVDTDGSSAAGSSTTQGRSARRGLV